jgi:hypothetical protein
MRHLQETIGALLIMATMLLGALQKLLASESLFIAAIVTAGVTFGYWAAIQLRGKIDAIYAARAGLSAGEVIINDITKVRAAADAMEKLSAELSNISRELSADAWNVVASVENAAAEIYDVRPDNGKDGVK